MEHNQTEGLWSLLCNNQVELLPTRHQHHCKDDHKPLAKFLNGKNANKKVNKWSLKLATVNI